MKNIASILVFVFAVTLTAQAQQKKQPRKMQFSAEQQTELAVKQMTLALDLSKKQQNEIKPILLKQAQEKKANQEKLRAFKESNTKPSADEMFAMKTKNIDARIEFKDKMQSILSPEQFDNFQKMMMKKGQKRKKMMMTKKKMMKRKKMMKNQKENN